MSGAWRASCACGWSGISVGGCCPECGASLGDQRKHTDEVALESLRNDVREYLRTLDLFGEAPTQLQILRNVVDA